MSEESKKSLFSGLWDRKVPQYLGTYFAVGFGLLQFVEFITKRYELKSHFVDKYLLLWLSLIPAIILFIYFSKELTKSGKTKLLKWPRILIIGNVLASFLLVVFLFNERNSNDAKIVELTDEEGNKIEAVVPSLNKVKTVAVFQFENLTGNKEDDWKGSAFSMLLEATLEQRSEYYASSVFTLNQYYDVLGLESFVVPNVGMQKEIAQKSRNDYFTRISYIKENDSYVFKGNLHQTSDGKNIIDINVSDKDFYLAIDKIKAIIVENIPNSFDNKNTSNLPSSSLITNNEDALKFITNASIAVTKNPVKGLQLGSSLVKKSIELDQSCSLCYFTLGNILFATGNKDEALINFKKSVKYGASLPERMQFIQKEIMYGVTNNAEAQMKLLELQRKMYPYEFRPYEQLSTLYEFNYGIDSVKALIQTAIDNGNREKGLLKMYDLLLDNEEYGKAEKILDQFTREFPDRKQDRLKYATLYQKQGKMQKAKDFLLQEEAIDPLNTKIQTQLAYMDFRTLNFEAANERLEKGFKQATTLTDSLNFLAEKSYFLRTTGQIKNALQVLERHEEYSKKRMPVVSLLISNFQKKSSMYQSVNQYDKINALLDEIRKYSPEAADNYLCLSTLTTVIEDYDNLITDEKNNYCKKMFSALGNGYENYYDLIVNYKDKEYDKCIAIIKKDNDRLENLLKQARYFLGKIYFKAGKIKEAKEILEQEINKKTYNPYNYYQMAVFFEKENPKKAQEYLDIALKFWTNADIDFIPAQRARELAKRLVFKT